MTSYAAAPRLPRAERSDFSPEQVSIWDHVVETRKLSFMPNMFAVMGQSPGALEAVASVGEHVRWHSALDDDLRELIICHGLASRRQRLRVGPPHPQGAGALPVRGGDAGDGGGTRRPLGQRSASPVWWPAAKMWTTRWSPSCVLNSAMPDSSISWR